MVVIDKSQNESDQIEEAKTREQDQERSFQDVVQNDQIEEQTERQLNQGAMVQPVILFLNDACSRFFGLMSTENISSEQQRRQ